MLVLICSLFSTPRTVGEIPTAMYASIALAISSPHIPNEIAADDSMYQGGEERHGERRYSIEEKDEEAKRENRKRKSTIRQLFLFTVSSLHPFPVFTLWHKHDMK